MQQIFEYSRFLLLLRGLACIQYIINPYNYVKQARKLQTNKLFYSSTYKAFRNMLWVPYIFGKLISLTIISVVIRGYIVLHI